MCAIESSGFYRVSEWFCFIGFDCEFGVFCKLEQKLGPYMCGSGDFCSLGLTILSLESCVGLCFLGFLIIKQVHDSKTFSYVFH